MTNGSLMKVKSIAEFSPWSILQYFWPALSDNRSWKPIFGIFVWPLKTGFTVWASLQDFGTYYTCPKASFKHPCWVADIFSGARGLNFGLSLHIQTYFMHASSEGSDEPGHLCRFPWAFIAWQCDKYQHLLCWFIKRTQNNTANFSQFLVKSQLNFLNFMSPCPIPINPFHSGYQ